MFKMSIICYVLTTFYINNLEPLKHEITVNLRVNTNTTQHTYQNLYCRKMRERGKEMAINFLFHQLTLFAYELPIFPTEISYLEVVAPPMSKGIFIANLSISLATKIISSKDGVMRPDRPIISIANLQTHMHKTFSQSSLERHRNQYRKVYFIHQIALCIRQKVMR